MKELKLIALLPLVYIVWWFYTLCMTIIPWLNVALSNIVSMTLLQIVGTILFFVLGIPILIICIVAFCLVLIH